METPTLRTARHGLLRLGRVATSPIFSYNPRALYIPRKTLYPLIREYTLNDTRTPNMISDRFPNCARFAWKPSQGVLPKTRTPNPEAPSLTYLPATKLQVFDTEPTA